MCAFFFGVQVIDWGSISFLNICKDNAFNFFIWKAYFHLISFSNMSALSVLPKVRCSPKLTYFLYPCIHGPNVTCSRSGQLCQWNASGFSCHSFTEALFYLLISKAMEREDILPHLKLAWNVICIRPLFTFIQVDRWQSSNGTLSAQPLPAKAGAIWKKWRTKDPTKTDTLTSRTWLANNFHWAEQWRFR